MAEIPLDGASNVIIVIDMNEMMHKYCDKLDTGKCSPSTTNYY